LHQRIEHFAGEGHQRIIVASDMVAPLKIARKYLADRIGDCGKKGDKEGKDGKEGKEGGWEHFTYDGSLGLEARQQAKCNFLKSERGIMYLSISAGGTGVHLVPGCMCMIFFGARPYSPAQVLQCSKRIHRIGQEHPVHIDHVIASGSVDDAIRRVGTDKQNLSDAVLDGPWSFADMKSRGRRWEPRKGFGARG
ncbi:MAG: C-terminal helicase domain-containing protein, partial [Novosphingobium sp.]